MVLLLTRLPGGEQEPVPGPETHHPPFAIACTLNPSNQVTDHNEFCEHQDTLGGQRKAATTVAKEGQAAEDGGGPKHKHKVWYAHHWGSQTGFT